MRSSALQRVQREATLANLLLAASASLQRETSRQWLPVPPPDFTREQPKLCWNLETAKRGFDLTRVTGWAFIEDGEVPRGCLPYLLAVGSNGTWLMPGTVVERPDVLQVFPVSGQAAADHRLKSGFVFEMSSGQLPDNISGLRVMLGSANRPPAISPEFQFA